MNRIRLLCLSLLCCFFLTATASAQVTVFPGACPPGVQPNALPNDNTPRFEFPAIPPSATFPGMDVGITVWRIPCGQSGHYALYLRMTDGGYLPGRLRPKVRIMQDGNQLGWIGTEVRRTPRGLQYFYGEGFQWVSSLFNLGTIRGTSETAPLISMTQFLQPGKAFTLRVRDTLDWPDSVPDLVYEIPNVDGSTATTSVPEGISGLWWNPEAPGWGVLIDRNADGIVLSAVLTYDEKGESTWYPMTRGELNARGEVTGDAFVVRGTPFAVNDKPTRFEFAPAGRFALTFSSSSNAKIHWTINGQTTLSPLQKFELRGTDGSLCRGTESIYSVDDLPGWAVQFQGSAGAPGCAVMGVLLTYDETQKPVWYFASLAPQIAAGQEASSFPLYGLVYRPTGTASGPAGMPALLNLGAPVGTWNSRVVDSNQQATQVEIKIGQAARTLIARPFKF